METNKSLYKVNKFYGDDEFVECMKKVIRQVNSKEICKIELSKDKAAVSCSGSSLRDEALRL